MLREMTCIVCPNGCDLEIQVEDGKVLSVKGALCRRAEAYAGAGGSPTPEEISPRRCWLTAGSFRWPAFG